MYIHIFDRVLPDGFLLKAIVFTLPATPPPPQLSCLATALVQMFSEELRDIELKLQ